MPALALGAADLERWSALQLADPSLASPFFRPEFTRAVAAVRQGVQVAVFEQGGRTLGFFPFERRTGGIGRPVGGALSDYQGAIAEAGASWDAAWLVRTSGLRAWDFDHLVATQTAFAPFHASHAGSPYLDLTDGFDAYRRERRAAGSKVIVQIERKARRLERVVGPLRFTAAEPDVHVLHRLLGWKSAQYRRTGKLDLFGARSTVALLERLHAERGPHFAGLLSTLHAGDALVAAHMGLRSRDAWHYWLPAYDPAHAAFTPGLVLLLEMARHAEGLGAAVLDLGRGGEDYKLRLMSGAFPLAEGSVTASRALAARRVLKHRVDAAAQRFEPAGAALRAARTLKLRLEDVRRRR